MSDLKAVLKAIQSQEAEAKKRHQELSSKIDNVIAKFDILSKKVTELDERTTSCEESMVKLKGELNALQQKELNSSVVIKGVPEKNGESATDDKVIVEQILGILGFQSNSAVVVKRIGRNLAAFPRLLLVKLNDEPTRNAVLKKKHSTKITLDKIRLKNLPLGQSTQEIYIDEHMTLYSFTMFRQLKELQKLYELKFVWMKQGKIYCKQNETSIPTVIHSQLEVDEYKKILRKRQRASSSGSSSGDSNLTCSENSTESVAQSAKRNKAMQK